MKKLFRKKTFPYILLFPSLLSFVTFFVYPIGNSIWLSLHIVRGETSKWGGLTNYINLLHDHNWWKSLSNMIQILIIQVPIMIMLAIILAVILNQASLKYKRFFRISFFIPSITSLVAYALMFSLLLEDLGLMNSLLEYFNFEPIPWLIDGVWAKISISIVLTWHWTGYNAIIFLTSLQNIPFSLYEAATLDGAKSYHKFVYITIPLLKPTILFTIVLSSIGTIQLFDEPYNLTKGGPDGATTSPTQLMFESFNNGELGYSSTIAYGIVIIVSFISFLQFKVLGEKND